MRNLYLKIIEIIENNRELFISKGLLPVETVDLYDAQPEEPGGFEFTCPALFIDYKIEWERGGSRLKNGVLNIDVHIITQPGPGTENFNPRLPEGLQKLEYYDLIAELMERVATDNVPSLALISEEPVLTDYFCYHMLRFNAPIYRHKQNRYTKLCDVKPDIVLKNE